MPRFQFRLERVLEWGRKKCRLEENRLADSLGLVRATERKMEQLRAERTSIETELLHRPSMAAADLVSLERYRLRATREAGQLAEERRQRVQSASEQRVRAQQARRRVKLLEKMRERRLEEHTALAERELETAATDNFLARWAPPRRAGLASKI